MKLHAIGAIFLVAALSSPASAETRNCTPLEKKAGDAQLAAIASDPARRKQIIKRHLPFGVHTGQHSAQGGPDNEKLLLQSGYTLLHDSDLRTGLWVSYQLTKADIDGAGPDRVNCFRQDPRLPKAATAVLSDFDEPIFDRGHLANDADLKDDLIEQINTYVLSNMSAQHCRFNRGIWLSLEYLGRIWAKEHTSIYVTSGAVFDFNKRDARDKDKSAGRMGSRNQQARVAIPSHYYKIFLRKVDDKWHSWDHLNDQNGLSADASVD